MSSHLIQGRDALIEALRQELLGPIPQGQPIDAEGELVFETDEEAYGPFRQLSNGEEIVHRDTPVRRYGVGILYPAGIEHHETFDAPEISRTEGAPDALPDPEEVQAGPLEAADLAEGDVEDQLARALEGIAGVATLPEDEPDELDLSSANALRPSTIGLSMLAELPAGSRLRVRVEGARYRRKKVRVKGADRWWWLREPITLEAEFSASTMLSAGRSLVRPDRSVFSRGGGLSLEVLVRARPESSERALLTVCLVNRTTGPEVVDERCLFQTRFDARIEAPDSQPHILAYPESSRELADAEARSIALLYRDAQTFAVGHGCSADWDQPSADGKTTAVVAEPLPAVEIPSITPDVRVDGQRLVASMGVLAGLYSDRDPWAEVQAILEGYRHWIGDRGAEVPTLPEHYRETAERHVADCQAAAKRMEDGLRLIQRDPLVAEAFRLANHAVLLQQLQQHRGVREAAYDDANQLIVFGEPPPSVDPTNPPEGLGEWRAFQIAFLLMTIPSVVDPAHPDRELVELIWFPTGGGKTEAYLGLTAFSIFLRRLRDPADVGVETLMRYTLRLLTAQQFQRAAALICAMETLRRGREELGVEPFTIGIWLGGGVTPNTREDAVEVLRGLRSGRRDVDNRFLLLKCPWCSAQMGPLARRRSGRGRGRRRSSAPNVLGYHQNEATVAFACPDRACDFSGGLPVLVIDEDIYERPPSLLIGTVDKFAMLAWRPSARALFGLDERGMRASSPPGLIIQDELHLISGPLGSMVGLYESLIEHLGTDQRAEAPIRPKIVSSTATIRHYEDQVLALYARSRVALFPPPGLSSSDSFFARWATKDDGSLAPGRVFLGVHSTTLPSMMTTQVRTYSALMQAAQDLDEDQRDPWWTLMVFFSSLRELGTALTLFQSDIRGYLVTIRNRLSIAPRDIRRLRNVVELTSRLRSDEIPAKINELEVTSDSQSPWAVDACLASSIIEVGVDIDRLSLMAVLTQPKTTSTYIQVTGRIGRRWWERPGLVVTLLSPQRPRDRSHYERFRSYHERLYAQVEPTSVTPFSPPALHRALHALMVAYVRQLGPLDLIGSPYPPPTELLLACRGVLRRRVRFVDPSEEDEFERIFDKKLSEWQRWERHAWGSSMTDEEEALLRGAGRYADPSHALVSWPTPTSLRSVDADCLAKVTIAYTQESRTIADAGAPASESPPDQAPDG